ncbi:MAG: alpha/beta fold hydrolase [Opitutales bacterium]
MPVELHFRHFPNPDAQPLVILHGLLGSSRNWTTVAKGLQARFDVYAPDLRNHGRSPHADDMAWPELMGDLDRMLQQNGLEQAVLIGHSLGGKVAMRYACACPEKASKLVIVDIAAKAYPPYHDKEIQAMRRVPLDEIESRKDAEDWLEPRISDWAMRQFLLTNLIRDGEGGYKWQVHLEALHANLPILRMDALLQDHWYDGPVLLLTGGKPAFVQAGDAEAMRGRLPNLQTQELPEAGHNPHIEDREGFLKIMEEWL